MSGRCTRYEEAVNQGLSRDRGEIQNHLAGCCECRAQKQADEALQEVFREFAQPALSPHFGRRVKSLVTQERGRRKVLSRWGRFLQVYWLTAAATSGVILLKLPWTGPSTPAAWLGIGALAMGFALPAAGLIWALRTNLVELVYSTFELTSK